MSHLLPPRCCELQKNESGDNVYISKITEKSDENNLGS